MGAGGGGAEATWRKQRGEMRGEREKKRGEKTTGNEE